MPIQGSGTRWTIIGARTTQYPQRSGRILISPCSHSGESPSGASEAHLPTRQSSTITILGLCPASTLPWPWGGLATMATTTLFQASSAEPLMHEGPLLILEPRTSALGSNPSFNASSILAKRQQHQIQITAATFSSVSVLAALCALYWFTMMRRNFRRDLVLLLIIGDFWKSFWFLVGSAATLARGQIPTENPFCQASGYFLQVGVEACGQLFQPYGGAAHLYILT